MCPTRNAGRVPKKLIPLGCGAAVPAADRWLPLEGGLPVEDDVEVVGIGAHLLGEDFDGNVAAELGVVGPLDLPNPAGAERRDDTIGAECGFRLHYRNLPDF